MKIESILSTLGLPVGLAVVLSGIALMYGIDLAQVSVVAGTLLGIAALITLTINVLKYAGVINDGVAGKLSAAGNLITLVGVAVVTRWYPQFNLQSADMQMMEFAKITSLVFAYITQIVASKRMHMVMVNDLGITVFSKTKTRAMQLVLAGARTGRA